MLGVLEGWGWVGKEVAGRRRGVGCQDENVNNQRMLYRDSLESRHGLRAMEK